MLRSAAARTILAMTLLLPPARVFAGPTPGLLDLLGQSGPMAIFVLALLSVLSIVSWGIMIERWRKFRSSDREDRALRERLANGAALVSAAEFARHLSHSPLAGLLAAFQEEVARFQARGLLGPDGTAAPHNPGQTEARIRQALERTLEKSAISQSHRFQAFLGFLATTATIGPFVGLFGTVWGIMNAFRSIGAAGVANIAAYAPGIAEALVTTAAGLAAAIPAVVGYNYFIGRVRRLEEEMEDFASDLLLKVEPPPR